MKIKDIVIEEINQFNELNEELEIMGLGDLARMIARTGWGEDGIPMLFNLLKDAFRKGGDSEVKDTFKHLTNTDIDDVRSGQYVFKQYGNKNYGRKYKMDYGA